MRSLLALAIFVPFAAGASEERHVALFDHAAHLPDASIERSLSALARACLDGEMSRMGPSPAQMRRCNAAEKRVVAFGPRVVPFVLDRIEAPDATTMELPRYYDVLGRVGDLELVEPLVRALERATDEGGDDPRAWDRSLIARALTQITYADVKGTPALQWRAWSTAHRGKSRADLLAERMTEVDELLAHGRFEQKVECAVFLGERASTRPRARQVLKALAAQKDLTDEERMQARDALGGLDGNGPSV